MDPAAHPEPGLSPLAPLPARVSIYEVGPRDGLQNEARALPTADKIRLVQALVDAGHTRIEVTSFVSPKWIPQLSDAEDVLRALPRPPVVTYSALVPNLRGLERAKAVGLDEACVFMSVTEGHSRHNLNKSVAEATQVVREVTVAARQAGMRVRAYLSCVWGCPFEGKVPLGQVLQVLRSIADLDLYQVSLGDTIGVGTPGHTQGIIHAARQIIPLEKLALHLHDTRGTALANALVGLQQGITTFDAAVGGLGGCPYAPGAAGNLASEDLLFMLEGLGVQTGLSLEKLTQAGELAQALIGRRLPGKYLQAALGERERASSGEP